MVKFNKVNIKEYNKENKGYNKEKNNKEKKAWVIAVDMGYGHQRAAYPLKEIAYERIITANNDKIISPNERKIWENTRKVYEFVSRLKTIPYLGNFVFSIYDKFQYISPLYPFRDLSKPDFNTILLKNQVLKKGLCKSLIEYIKKIDIPVIATHPIPAIAAHYFGLKNIFSVVTDTDIARAWVIDNPKENNITYFVPCIHVAVRLREYGISENKIVLTGFPLPKENIGENKSILKKDLAERLEILDPNKVFLNQYKDVIYNKIGKNIFNSLYYKKSNKKRILTIMYAVGGAGSLVGIGKKILSSLREKIINNKIKIILSAGVRLHVRSYYEKIIHDLGLQDYLNKNIIILFELSKKEYFNKFNLLLRETDILWTKPSELSFFTALGLPIIIAPPIGSQENYNKLWLTNIGSGFVQENPDYVDDWLFYWLNEGRLAKAAWQGFIDAPSMGSYQIESFINKNF